MFSQFANRYHLNKEVSKIIGITFILAIICFYLMSVMANIASYWSLPGETQRLPDMVLDSFFVDDAYDYVDILLNIFTVMTIIMPFIRRDALFIIFRYIICLSFCYLLRITTVSVTNLPSPSACNKKVDILTNFNFNRCGDLIFSGHTIVFTTNSLVWSTYKITRSVILNIVLLMSVWIVSGVGVIGLLVFHKHYTVDVVISVYIAIGVWLLFANLCEKYFKKDKWFEPLLVYFDE
ncbi:Phosphatidylcholine:ceramide cholinephosphotransferase 2 [Dictyocoela roeselum]|nr:Phosphatidylcholine:ceramide cholinephosphotransferase 2 [Dictyocoela roeselum]